MAISLTVSGLSTTGRRHSINARMGAPPHPRHPLKNPILDENFTTAKAFGSSLVCHRYHPRILDRRGADPGRRSTSKSRPRGASGHLRFEGQHSLWIMHRGGRVGAHKHLPQVDALPTCNAMDRAG